MNQMGQRYVLLWVGGGPPWLPANRGFPRLCFLMFPAHAWQSIILDLGYRACVCVCACVCFLSCFERRQGFVCVFPLSFGGIAPTWIFLGCCDACRGQAVAVRACDKAKMSSPGVMWREGFDTRVRVYMGQMPRSKQQIVHLMLGFDELPDL